MGNSATGEFFLLCLVAGMLGTIMAVFGWPLSSLILCVISMLFWLLGVCSYIPPGGAKNSQE